MKRYLFALAFVGCVALAGARPAGNPAAEMGAEAQRFLDALTPEQRSAAAMRFEDDERKNWHFVPRARKGIPAKQLSAGQRELGEALLRTGLGPEGIQRVAAIRQLETVLFEMEGGRPIRDPELYFYSVFGAPTAKGDWGWRFEGHHLSLNFTIHNGAVIATSPSFFGANPAEVRGGAKKGARALAPEEDLGRQLFLSFSGAAREKVLLDVKAPDEIVTGASRKAEIGPPQGVAMSAMSSEQARLLRDLLSVYVQRLRPELAEAELARIRKAGMDKIHFAWAGSGTPGEPHYYRIQGPTFLIEYDNTQNNANHIHTVWRDLEKDFGVDLLAAHYRTSPHHQHTAAARHRHGVSGGR